MGMSTNSGTLLERDATILAGVFAVQELRDSLALWQQANAALAGAQSYTIAGRELTRADAAEVRNNLLLYARAVAIAEAKAAGLATGGPRFVTAIFSGGLGDHG